MLSNPMWKEFLRICLHDPIIWLAFVAAVIAVFGLRAEARRRRLIEQFAIARGFEFQRALEPKTLRLAETDFFQRRDHAINEVRGKLGTAQFTLFDHVARRGKRNSFTQTVVAFVIDPSTSFRPTTLGSYGFQIEKTEDHLFLWQERQRAQPDNLDPFLRSALNIFQQATR